MACLRGANAQTLAFLLLASAPLVVRCARVGEGRSLSSAYVPAIGMVLDQLKELKGMVESEVKEEQKEYDAYACWCEETTKQKAMEISELEKHIMELEMIIMKDKGALGVDAGEIHELTIDIAANVKATEEANAMHEKDVAAIVAEKAEVEQFIGALEAAINVLSGAGIGSQSNLLSTIQEAQLISAVAGVRDLLSNARVPKMVDEKDLQVVQEFVAKPCEFVRSENKRDSAGFLEAPNRFGDYSQKSGQIQGILKEMYDSFCKELEKLDVDEGTKTKTFESLIDLKESELASLKTQINKFGSEKGDIIQSLAAATSEHADCQRALKEAKEFFDVTKKNCKEKVIAWSTRTKLRTQEILGIQKVLDILNSPEAKATFGLGESFLQKGAPHHVLLKVHKIVSKADMGRERAYDMIVGLAKKYGTYSLANLAAEVKLCNSHFDKVISMIDKLVEVLEQQGKDDIAHKTYCEKENVKQESRKEELKELIAKTEKAIEIRNAQIKETGEEIAELDKKMNSTKEELTKLSHAKSAETLEYNKVQEANRLAVKILKMASEATTQFYKKHGFMTIQTDSTTTVKVLRSVAAPAAAEAHQSSTAEAPQSSTNWDQTDYHSGVEGAKGVIQILQVVREDVENQIRLSREQEEASMKEYLEMRDKFVRTIDADQKIRNSKLQQMAVHEKKLSYEKVDLQQAGVDEAVVEKVLKALTEECAWVKTHFESRTSKRKAEIEGLKEAKRVLRGAAAVVGLSQTKLLQ